MYMGVPVVAFDVGSIREIVADGTNGFVVHSRDVSVASARVISILASQEMSGRMGRSGRVSATDRFSVDRMIRDYERLFRRHAET
jgi:glycosyltransferase involved in cell wall biosynthesis